MAYVVKADGKAIAELDIIKNAEGLKAEIAKWQKSLRKSKSKSKMAYAKIEISEI